MTEGVKFPKFGTTFLFKMRTVQIPLNEYKHLQEELLLLKDSKLLAKLNKLIDLLYKDKYGLVLSEHTEDLTKHAIDKSWDKKKSVWDEL